MPLKYDLNDERVKYLISTDFTFGKLIRYIGTSELEIEKDGFKCIVKYIIGQQISDKARETIWKKLSDSLEEFSPYLLLSISDSNLRVLGLSGRKIEYIKTFATGIIERKIDFDELQYLTNEEIISKLISFRGIGQWTAEMYLIFSLEKENVLSKGDGTIRRTIQWMYNLTALPSAKELEERFVNWNKYATIVSAYLWKAIKLGLTKKIFTRCLNWREGKHECR